MRSTANGFAYARRAHVSRCGACGWDVDGMWMGSMLQVIIEKEKETRMLCSPLAVPTIKGGTEVRFGHSQFKLKKHAHAHAHAHAQPRMGETYSPPLPSENIALDGTPLSVGSSSTGIQAMLLDNRM
jgi:hypothetical protein